MESAPWIILLAVLVYGFVHSTLAAIGVKARVRGWLGAGVDRWYRLAYNTFGILTFMPVLVPYGFIARSGTLRDPSTLVLPRLGRTAAGFGGIGYWVAANRDLFFSGI